MKTTIKISILVLFIILTVASYVPLAYITYAFSAMLFDAPESWNNMDLRMIFYGINGGLFLIFFISVGFMLYEVIQLVRDKKRDFDQKSPISSISEMSGEVRRGR